MASLWEYRVERRVFGKPCLASTRIGIDSVRQGQADWGTHAGGVNGAVFAYRFGRKVPFPGIAEGKEPVTFQRSGGQSHFRLRSGVSASLAKEWAMLILLLLGCMSLHSEPD